MWYSNEARAKYTAMVEAANEVNGAVETIHRLIYFHGQLTTSALLENFDHVAKSETLHFIEKVIAVYPDLRKQIAQKLTDKKDP